MVPLIRISTAGTAVAMISTMHFVFGVMMFCLFDRVTCLSKVLINIEKVSGGGVRSLSNLFVLPLSVLALHYTQVKQHIRRSI